MELEVPLSDVKTAVKSVSKAAAEEMKDLAGAAFDEFDLDDLLPEGVDLQAFTDAMLSAMKFVEELASDSGLTPLIDNIKEKISTAAKEYVASEL